MLLEINIALHSVSVFPKNYSAMIDVRSRSGTRIAVTKYAFLPVKNYAKQFSQKQRPDRDNKRQKSASCGRGTGGEAVV